MNKRGIRVLAIRFTKEAWSELFHAMRWVEGSRAEVLGIVLLNDAKANIEGRKFGVEYAHE